MARLADSRHRTTVGTWFRLLLRVVGLLAVPAALVGLALTWQTTPSLFSTVDGGKWTDTFTAVLDGGSGQLPRVALIILLAGIGALVLWGLVELLGGLTKVAGRKSAAGAGNAVLVVLAAALLVVVNAISFLYYARFDGTRDKRFTLEPELVEKLQQLDPNTPTTVVVLQRDKTSSLEPEKSDAITTAAQQKITEKVLDLIDVLRERKDIGTRIDVRVLNTKDEDFEKKLKALTDATPAPPGEADAARKLRELRNKERATLADAVKDAPENSIFFAANGRVSRLGFGQFLMLDKTASLAEDRPADDRDAARNLVLAPQGRAAFINKMLTVESKKPKVGLAVIHPVLSSRANREELSAGGLRKSLEANGFEVSDVILKKGWGRGSPPSPAAATFDEDRLTQSEGRFRLYSLLVYDRELAVKQLQDEKKRIEKAPLAALNKEFAEALGQPVLKEEDRQAILNDIVEPTIQFRSNELSVYRTRLEKVAPAYAKLSADDRLLETRRDVDVKAKLDRYVAECDVLVVPRLTVMDVSRGESITARLFNLSADQAETVKAFLAAGKPVLFAFGPTNADGAPQNPFDPSSGPDDVERLIGELKITLGKQTVVTDIEAESAAETKDEMLAEDVDVPPLSFKGKGNRIAAAYEALNRSTGGKLVVKRSGFRPIYTANEADSVLFTSADSWNEAKPLPDRGYVPTFDPPKPSVKKTDDTERRGPFSVGVATEVTVPADWVKGDAKAGTVRVAAYGHGGLFIGNTLQPGQEALLLTSLHWLLGHDDDLPKDVPADARWQYPRVRLTPIEQFSWQAGAFLGLPVLVAVLGIIALMFRYLR